MVGLKPRKGIKANDKYHEWENAKIATATAIIKPLRITNKPRFLLAREAKTKEPIRAPTAEKLFNSPSLEALT